MREERIPTRTTTVEGEERHRLWKLMAEAWPDYDEYQKKPTARSPWWCLNGAERD